MNIYVESNFVLELALLQEQYASCEDVSHLKQSGAPQSCFLNKNSRDFDDPDLVEELNTYNCKLLPRFDIGYQFILSQIS